VTLATELRPLTDADGEFLFQLYANTRDEELALVPWSAHQKEQFLRMQFHAQSVHYEKYFPSAQFDLIVCEGQPAGRLIVDRRPEEVHIIDIALAPAFRRQGIGTAYLKTLRQEAHDRGVPLRIFVECNNPARRLYERLGFRQIGEQGIYLQMECVPPATGARPES
jgi:ribosomal protein S18 acetylase RimI-like enzyme